MSRFIALVIAFGLVVTASCFGHGFAPTLDVKGPSKQQIEQNKWKEKNDNKKAHNKCKNYDSGKSKKKPSKKDKIKAGAHVRSNLHKKRH